MHVSLSLKQKGLYQVDNGQRLLVSGWRLMVCYWSIVSCYLLMVSGQWLAVSAERCSPQLNMCDYALWVQVEKRMRAQEKRFSPSFRESRPAFLKRLRRTALRLPSSFVNDSLTNMKIRCQRLVAAEGGHIEEGR